MEWLNVHVSTLRSAEYIGSNPVERATWLSVLSWCCEQENGGRIVGAAEWKDRQWQQTCGATLREVKSCPKLLVWEGNDLVVKFYPVDKELEVKKKREAGRKGGIHSGESRASSIQRSTASSTASPELHQLASTEGKGKEGEGKEKGKEGNGISAPEALLHVDPAPPPPPAAQTQAEAIYSAYPRKQGKQDALKAIEKALKSAAFDHLLARTKAYAEATQGWNAKDREFIPHPATWFNRGSYDDDPQTWVRFYGNPNQMPKSDHSKGF